MALQVWLPLTEDLENKGFSDLEFTSTVTAGFEQGKIGNALQVNGSNVRFVAEGLTDIDTFSVAFWYKPESDSSITTNYNKVLTFATKNADGTSGSLFRFESSYNHSGTYALSAHNNTSQSLGAIGHQFIGSMDEWHHVCLVHTPDENLSYLDGELFRTGDGAAGTLTGVCIIAAKYSGTDPKGLMNDLRIYDHALSTKEVKELSKALIAHYPLNDKVGLPNLMLNSLPADSTNWTLSAPSGTHAWEVTEKDGCKCFHVTGDLTRGKYIVPKYSTSGGRFTPEPNEYITMSCDVLFENVTLGSTNAYIQLYASGATIDGTYRGTKNVSDNGYSKQFNGWYNLDPDKLNDRGWTHVYITYQYLNYDYPSLAPSFYARDFDGDVYVKCLKLEQGSTPTPWVPNEADDEYTELGLDEDIVYDRSGYCHHGTPSSNPPTVIGDSRRYSVCTQFNGSNNFITLGRDPMVTDAVSVSVWGYMNDWSKYQRLISCTESGGWNIEPTSGKLHFPVYKQDIGYARSTPKTALADFTPGWHHLVGTFDGYVSKLYLDGELEGTSTDAQPTIKAPIRYNANNVIFIGAEAAGNANTPAGNYFNGRISDVRIYATALSAEDIKELYETSASVDQNGNTWAYEFTEV